MDWNPFEKVMQDNPYPTFQWFRDNLPVYHNSEIGFYALTLYEDVLAGFADSSTFVNSHGTTIEGVDAGIETLLHMDPPEHTIQRSVISRVFTGRRVAELEPAIRAASRQMLQEARGRGMLDVVTEFSTRLPLFVISELVGLPPSRRDEIHALCDRVLLRDDDTPAGEVSDAARAAFGDLLQVFGEVAKERRVDLGEDVLSRLIRTPVELDDNQRLFLTDEQLAARLFELTVAGFETVMKLIANGVVALSWYRDQRRELVAEPSLLGNAVEEIVRWDPPSPLAGRWSTRDVAIHGVTIPENSRVLLVIASATHDERVYKEPESFSIRRDIGRQLGFGFGPHLCLGAALARLETRVALEELLAFYPDYELGIGIERAYGTPNIRGLKHLPIVLTAAA